MGEKLVGFDYILLLAIELSLCILLKVLSIFVCLFYSPFGIQNLHVVSNESQNKEDAAED